MWMADVVGQCGQMWMVGVVGRCRWLMWLADVVARCGWPIWLALWPTCMGTHVDMCIDLCMDTGVDICVNTCIDMCIDTGQDMWVGVAEAERPPPRFYQEHMCARVCKHVYRHGVCGPALAMALCACGWLRLGPYGWLWACGPVVGCGPVAVVGYGHVLAYVGRVLAVC